MPETNAPATLLKRFWSNRLLRNFAILVGALVALTVVMILSAPNRSKSSGSASAQEKAGAPSFESSFSEAVEVRSFANSFSTQISQQSAKVSKLETEVSGLRADLKRLQSINSTLAQLLTELQEQANITPPSPSGGAFDKPPAEQVPSPRLRRIDINRDKSKDRKRVLLLPAGSFASCTLLSGIYAPVSGEPLPVLLRIDELAVGPNKSRVPIRGAFLIGKAQGDANSKRAIIQLTALSIVRSDGQAHEFPINGYLADADGIQGVRGIYVDRVTEVAGHASLAAGLDGLANIFKTASSTRLVNPLGGVTDILNKDAGKVAGLSSASSALSKLSEIYSRRLDDIKPAISVMNGKRVTAVILKSVSLDDFDPEAIPNESQNSPYNGLDVHR